MNRWTCFCKLGVIAILFAVSILASYAGEEKAVTESLIIGEDGAAFQSAIWSEISLEVLADHYSEVDSVYDYGFQLKGVPEGDIEFPYVLIQTNVTGEFPECLEFKSFGSMEYDKFYVDGNGKFIWFRQLVEDEDVYAVLAIINAGNHYIGVYGYASADEIDKRAPMLRSFIENITVVKSEKTDDGHFIGSDNLVLGSVLSLVFLASFIVLCRFISKKVVV